MEGIRIGPAITAVDLTNYKTRLLRVNEATKLGKHSNTLLSTKQIREHGITIADRPRKQGERSCMMVDGSGNTRHHEEIYAYTHKIKTSY